MSPSDHLAISQALCAKWSPFPNVTTRAWYSYFSQMITLKEITVDDWKKGHPAGDITYQLKTRPIAFHELQHFWDHVATRWGRDELRKLFKAFAVRNSDNHESFGIVTQLTDDLRRYDYSDFYTEQYKGFALPWDGKPWRFNSSIGYEVRAQGGVDKTRPIPFYRFSTHDGVPVCRVPLTIASLLEVRAMAIELDTRLRLAKKLPNGQWQVEWTLCGKELKAMIYDPALAKYSVAAHFLANTLGSSDIFDAYKLASILAGIALMIPIQDIRSMHVPTDLQAVEGIVAMRDRGDRVFAYISLVDAARESRTGETDDLVSCMNHVGLSGYLDRPTVDVVSTSDTVDMPQPLNDRLKDLLEVGETMLTPTGPMVKDSSQTPSFILADGVGTNGMRTSRVPEGAWHEAAFRLHNQIVEFVNASF